MSTSDELPNLTGRCHCGKVEFSVHSGKVLFNHLCHCKNCSRARSVSPVHILGVPTGSLAFSNGSEEFLKVTGGYAGIMEFASCSACHCGVYQCPKGANFVALFPTTFQVSQGEKGCKLPPYLLPVAHINYENRAMDWTDDLPKFEVWPEGKVLNNDGSLK